MALHQGRINAREKKTTGVCVPLLIEGDSSLGFSGGRVAGGMGGGGVEEGGGRT